jgi:hypothetical protein
VRETSERALSAARAKISANSIDLATALYHVCQRTSALCALARRDSDTRDPASTASVPSIKEIHRAKITENVFRAHSHRFASSHSSGDSQLHVPGRGLHQRKRNWRQVHLSVPSHSARDAETAAAAAVPLLPLIFSVSSLLFNTALRWS